MSQQLVLLRKIASAVTTNFAVVLASPISLTPAGPVRVNYTSSTRDFELIRLSAETCDPSSEKISGARGVSCDCRPLVQQPAAIRFKIDFAARMILGLAYNNWLYLSACGCYRHDCRTDNRPHNHTDEDVADVHRRLPKYSAVESTPFRSLLRQL